MAEAQTWPSDLVEQMRGFNRFYTQILGNLERGYLDTEFSLPEARALFEVARDPGCTARDVQERTSMDQAHLSRILARLDRKGFVARRRSASDGRAQELRLTEAGERAFGTLDVRAKEQVRELAGHLPTGRQQELSAAFAIIKGILGARVPEPKVVVRNGRVGDLGWTFYRQAVVYANEFGYDDVFERYVCDGLPAFLDHFDPKRDRLWMAEAEGRCLGFIALHHVDDRPRWAKLRWFLVEKDARGLGVGTRLLDESVRFCKEAGYEGIFLWTVNDLHAARKLYERAGFTLTKEADDCPWADWGKEQCWELRLEDDS